MTALAHLPADASAPIYTAVLADALSAVFVARLVAATRAEAARLNPRHPAHWRADHHAAMTRIETYRRGAGA